MLNSTLFTIESSGALYATNLTDGSWHQIGKAEFGATKFLAAANSKLYTIEKSGTLYQMNPVSGT